jgi:hypothetical protein
MSTRNQHGKNNEETMVMLKKAGMKRLLASAARLEKL